MVVLNTPTIKNHDYEEITIVTTTAVSSGASTFINLSQYIEKLKIRAINDMISKAQIKNADAIINTNFVIPMNQYNNIITATGTAVKILD